MRRNMGGRPNAENPKVAVSLHLDQNAAAQFEGSQAELAIQGEPHLASQSRQPDDKILVKQRQACQK